MLKELDIIQQIARQSGHPEYLADDAFFEPETRRIYTTDMLVENRHFRLDYFSPEDLGWRAAAVNVSDLAAMGGRLKYLLVSLGLPETVDLPWVERFYQGMLALCAQYDGELAGGDTVGSAMLVVNVTAVGECPPAHTPGYRKNARPGDYIVTTGYHGLSAVGMQALQARQDGYEAARQAHLRPQPRVDEGLALSARFQCYALMDSSDGLADALIKIARASQARLVVDVRKLPVHPQVQGYCQTQGLDPLQTLLYGGEDFELVAAVPEVDAELMAHFKVIGRVEALNAAGGEEPGAWLQHPDGTQTPLSLAQTYHHFKEAGHGSR